MAKTARLITVFNQKGGCGKSTTTMSLAGEFGRRGYDVMVIDLDRQGTSSRWRGQTTERAPFPASVINLAHQGANMILEVQRMLPKHDVLIVDCPPDIRDDALSAALLLSDLALMPLQPSPADMWALDGAKTLLNAARRTNTTLQARVVPIRVPRRQRLATAVLSSLAEDPEVQLTEATLGSLGAYGIAMLDGRAIHDVPDAATAIAEVEALADEVGTLIGLKRRAGGAK